MTSEVAIESARHNHQRKPRTVDAATVQPALADGGELPELRTIAEAAEWLRVSQSQVRTMIRDRRLPALRVAGSMMMIRIRQVDLVALLTPLSPERERGERKAARGVEEVGTQFYEEA